MTLAYQSLMHLDADYFTSRPEDLRKRKSPAVDSAQENMFESALSEVSRRVSGTRSIVLTILEPIFVASLKLSELSSIIARLVNEVAGDSHVSFIADRIPDQGEGDPLITCSAELNLGKFRQFIKSHNTMNLTGGEAEAMPYKMSNLLSSLLSILDQLQVALSHLGLYREQQRLATTRQK